MVINEVVRNLTPTLVPLLCFVFLTVFNPLKKYLQKCLVKLIYFNYAHRLPLCCDP